MAMYAPFTKNVISGEEAVAPGAVISAEGQALVRSKGAYSAGVLPSTGTDSDVFVGFATGRTSAAVFPETFTNKVEKFVVPATGAVTLQFPPITGQVFVYDETAGAPVATPTVVDKQVTGLDAGSEVRVVYKYSLTVTQARALFGDIQPGGYVGDEVGQIGVIKVGQIYTSEFDASVDWDSVEAIKLGANGILEGDAGTGIAINAVVVAAPNELTPFLGINFTAPNAA